MIGIYIDGKQVGLLTISEAVLRENMATNKVIEAQNDHGWVLGSYQLSNAPLFPEEPSITAEELLKRGREPGGKTLKEFWASRGH